MRYRRAIFSLFFFFFIVVSSLPIHAKVGELSVMKEFKEEGPVEIVADELFFERESQLYEAHGQVKVTRGNLSLKADHVRLNMATKDLVAWGNVLLSEGEDVMECQRLEVNLETRLGKIFQATLFLKDQNFHIIGREVEKLGENHYRIRKGSLTTCDARPPPWKFTVEEIEVREMALGGWGVAKGPLFHIRDIPVLYLPWGAFPVRQDRQTGFLIPQVGYSNKYGAEVKTGFYWAMRKDMDATLYLDYLGERGFKEGLEYRYALTRDTKGEANVYFIDDWVYEKNRYAFFIKHQQMFPHDFYLKGDINYVSDNQYLQDFDEDIPDMVSLDARSSRLLRSVLFGGKNWDQFSFLADVEVYDNLAISSNDRTVQKLPKIRLVALPQSLFKTPLFYELSTSYTYFWRDEGVEAQRGDFFPIISYPMRLFNIWKFYPYLGGRETLYYSSNDPNRTYRGLESRETLDAGFQTSMELYRVYDAGASSKISDLFKVGKWMHTIEPTIAYHYSPRVTQTQFPVFDDVDRIPYANEITYGVTQRLIGKPIKEAISSGPYEYAKLMIYQSYSLGDPYIDSEGKKRSFSNIRAELWWNFNPYLSARWDTEISPYGGNVDVLNFLIQAKDRRNDTVRIQYRYTKDDVKGINIDGRVKTIDPLYLYGAFRYDFQNDYRVVSIWGAEYQAQCWSASLVVEHWGQSPTGTQKSETKIRLNFTLLNLGSFGRKPYFMKL